MIFAKTTLHKVILRCLGFFILLCMLWNIRENAPPLKIMTKEAVTVISELAYDNNPDLGYRIYLKESERLIPYLVLTNNYNGSGNTLLLREFVSPDDRRYNEYSWYAAYYNESEIDEWLSNDFLATIEDIEIVDSTINISAKEALARSGRETEDIIRKVFLLSWGEVGGPKMSIIPASGEPLKYFNYYVKRVAYREGRMNERSTWFLRSVDTWEFIKVAVISQGGTFATGATTNYNGIRPAFCVQSNTEVALIQDTTLGEIFIFTQ